MPTYFQLKTYLRYWLDAVGSHSLHSPFFYDLYTKVINRDDRAAGFPPIEHWRTELLSSKEEIEVQDPGSGSVLHGGLRQVCDIARTSLSSPQFSRLYARLIRYFGCKNAIELGTSLGVNALYLSATTGTKLTTFEGVSSIATIARRTFTNFPSHDITLVAGDIAKTLPGFLAVSPRIDFAFMDANHRYTPTLQYAGWLFEKTHHKSIVVVDDIHYTDEMEQAWEALKRHRLVYASADLYRCGLLFFDPSLDKQHVVLQA
ncbi:MAG TPA: class I SAM-dependent methyltransferase [Ohtaekwangia sp.]|nr:class I SAM-dependent methyltransferase [Ohtaekwangia sp.]